MKLFTLLQSALSLASVAQAASLLAVDLGTDSFKASLVKPGVPFDVLVTKEGRRKTQSLVTLRKEDRSFGGEAANLVSWQPRASCFDALRLTSGLCSTKGHAVPTRYFRSRQTAARSPCFAPVLSAALIALFPTARNDFARLTDRFLFFLGLVPCGRGLGDAARLRQGDGR